MSTAVACDKCCALFHHQQVADFGCGVHFCRPRLKEQIISYWRFKILRAEKKLKRLEDGDLPDLVQTDGSSDFIPNELRKSLIGQGNEWLVG